MLQLGRRRSSIEIIGEILRLSESGKSDICRAVGIHSVQCEEYLARMSESRLVDRIAAGRQTATYRVTDRGLKLLKEIDGLIEMLGEKTSGPTTS